MAILQLHSIASDSPAKKQLSPKMQSACSNTHTHTHTHTTCIRQPRQKKVVESQDAMQVSTQPQLHLMARANHEVRCLSLCLLHLFGVAGPARHSIGLPLMHSNLPKGRQSSKDWSTLLQLLLALLELSLHTPHTTKFPPQPVAQ